MVSEVIILGGTGHKNLQKGFIKTKPSLPQSLTDHLHLWLLGDSIEKSVLRKWMQRWKEKRLKTTLLKAKETTQCSKSKNYWVTV